MYKEFIGVDLHSTQVTVHRIIVGQSGEIERRKSQYPMEQMETHFIGSLHPGCVVCMEAGSGSHMLARMIVAAGARAFVVNPLSMPQIFMTAKKTDGIDAKKLADCLKQHLENNDPNDGFPEVTVADEDTKRLLNVWSATWNIRDCHLKSGSSPARKSISMRSWTRSRPSCDR